ncbi:MAG: FAD/NAD(P)-binding protein [Flavobacteriia bacterium]
MKNIAIIGGGFSGTMTAVQLIKKASSKLSICIIEPAEQLFKGAAYNSYSEKHLLNVTAAKMSGFTDQPEHFLNWVMMQDSFKFKNRELISNSFLSRNTYGNYLISIWEESLQLAAKKGIDIVWFKNRVTQLKYSSTTIKIQLDNSTNVECEKCVLATGNLLPRNPFVLDSSVLQNKNYFQNPWQLTAVINKPKNLPVLIVGNGLTMVDTVIGLKEHGFKGKIYAVSPNGFNILPHRHNGIQYKGLDDELTDDLSLNEIVTIINRHVKSVREFGISAEPIVDALRPRVQKIWKKMSTHEKQLFMSRLRHLWGVARHRIPLHIHDKIQNMRIEGTLLVKSGKILDIKENAGVFRVSYWGKKTNQKIELDVSSIINCTGPETDLGRVPEHFLNACLNDGIISQDSLKLGIAAETTSFKVKDGDGNLKHNLFTLGSNLKGELWESTAVNELRQQAEKLAEQLLLESQ